MANDIVITLDMDGVICGGGYTPPEQRTAQHYRSLKPISNAVVGAVIQLARRYTVYITTARNFPDARRETQRWLRDYGMWQDLAGLITDANRNKRFQLIWILSSKFHFDDDASNLAKVYNITQPVLIHNPGYNDEYYKQRTVPVLDSLAEAPAYIRKKLSR